MQYKAFVAALGSLAALAALPAAADYPERTIEVLVPAPAGGGTDVSARQLARLLETELGQSVVIMNVAGGGGSVGLTQAAQARPDGYSLLATWNSPLTTVPQVQPVQYDLTSFTPIASTSETAYTLCVAPDFPADNGGAFLQHLADNPDAYTYGNDGVGGTMQLAAERIFQAYGARVVPIPFGGAGETLQNFLGGHVDIYGGSIAPVLPYVESGEAKCLIVTSAEAIGALPQAAGLAELGHPELETLLWRAFLGPAGLDPAQVERLAEAIETAVHDASYVEFLAKQGEQPNVLTGEALQRRLEAEYRGLAEVAEALGLTQ